HAPDRRLPIPWMAPEARKPRQLIRTVVVPPNTRPVTSPFSGRALSTDATVGSSTVQSHFSLMLEVVPSERVARALSVEIPFSGTRPRFRTSRATDRISPWTFRLLVSADVM